MRFFVLGANGKTGSEFLDLALAKGHWVTAYVRSPWKITRRDPGLTVVQGDLTNVEGMAEAMKGHDAVISALGPTPGEAFKPHHLLDEMAFRTAAAMEHAGVKKVYFVSSAALFPGGGPVTRLFRWLFRHHVEDLRGAEKFLADSRLDWTIARPPRLDKIKGESFTSREGALPKTGFRMSFRGVANFMLQAAEKGANARQVVGLGR